MSARDRAHNQDRFMREEGVIMVATVAFGMGVDKPNVRFVCHLEPPKSLEAYHQETGRAGRDGLPASAWMCFGMQDIAVLRSMIDSGEANGTRKMVEHAKLGSLFAFLETAGCRRQALLSYFGEHIEPCGNCDNCLTPVDTWDGTVAAQKALSNIFRTEQRFGVNYLTQVLVGKETDRIQRFGHHKVSTFGIGMELSQEQWKSVYRQLLASGLVSVDLERFNALTLNDYSWPVLTGKQKVLLRSDPVLPRKNKKKKRAMVVAEDILNSWEAEALFDTLRDLRLEVAKEQGVAPYAIFPDKTLLELVRYRPWDLDSFGCMPGVGLTKLKHYGERFLHSLKEHENEHGRPAGVPEIPDELRERQEKRITRSQELSGTAKTSLDLFLKLGDIDQVAQKRDLKPASIWKHLTDAARLEKIDYRTVADLPKDEMENVELTIKAFRKQGIASMTPVFESLDQKYPFELLRLVRACV